MSIDDMTKRLGDAGFALNETEAARFILGRFSYQHLSEYFPLFEKPECNLKKSIVTLYLVMYVDMTFQEILLEFIGWFELQFRAAFSTEMSTRHGAFAHRDPSLFVNRKYFEKYLKDYRNVLISCMKQNGSRAKRDIKKYGDMPIWEAFEEMTLGMLSKLYSNLADVKVKKAVAKSFGVSVKTLESWAVALSFARNRCAHFGKLLGSTLVKPPMKIDGVDADNTSPFYLVLVLMRALRTNTSLGEPSLMPGISLAQYMYYFLDAYADFLPTLQIPSDWRELLGNNNVSGLNLSFDGSEPERRPINIGMKFT